MRTHQFSRDRDRNAPAFVGTQHWAGRFTSKWNDWGVGWSAAKNSTRFTRAFGPIRPTRPPRRNLEFRQGDDVADQSRNEANSFDLSPRRRRDPRPLRTRNSVGANNCLLARRSSKRVWRCGQQPAGASLWSCSKTGTTQRVNHSCLRCRCAVSAPPRYDQPSRR